MHLVGRRIICRFNMYLVFRLLLRARDVQEDQLNEDAVLRPVETEIVGVEELIPERPERRVRPLRDEQDLVLVPGERRPIECFPGLRIFKLSFCVSELFFTPFPNTLDQYFICCIIQQKGQNSPRYGSNLRI